ncbi:hypothetical protein PRIPAC_71854 [Pristionchus pacificus]|uniref:Uncharacterized protein n=1 Tax=Pristionchus pacificus TaxID=54126 RepID=A0A454XLV2_PRIPA|nr:hypothetical protein PRIPAC_71854 [Pristionchus pacificus]|eukprot:PDM64622.1 hypothetical protein PRIPAC_52878 [Pristionchus pacificus]
MDTPPPPYSEKDPIFPDPPSYSEKEIEQLLRRKLSRKSRLHSPPPPATPPPRPRRTKRDRWWFVCPPTFGRTHKECAVWHMYILVGITCFFLWMSVTVPNHLEATKNKNFDKNDREIFSKVLLWIGVSALPFALFGSVGLMYTIPTFLVVPATYYSCWMTAGIVSFSLFLMVFVNGTAWGEVEQTYYAAIGFLITVIVFTYLLHGYRIMMRVRNDMKDDYLDAHPELIEEFESEVSEVSECETLSQFSQSE